MLTVFSGILNKVKVGNMSRKRNREVASMWNNWQFGSVNHDNTLRVCSEGRAYSYRLLIAEVVDGKKIVYNHTSPGGSFYSVTTSKHVNLFKGYADRVISYV